ncbi:hypothetical protein BGZ70_005880, partial [Mortierella alpina]
PERRLPARPDPSLFSTVPAVSVARPALSVQGPAVRSIVGSTRVHQGTQASSSLGPQEGDQDIGVPGRPAHCSSHEGALGQGYTDGSTQTEAPGLLDQGGQIESDTITDHTAPGVRDRHSLHDAEDPWTKDPRRSEGSVQDVQQGNMHGASALVIHRQGHRHDSGSLPSSPQGPASASSQDPCTEIGIILGGIDLSATGSNGGAHVVAHQLATVERDVMDCVQPTSGHLHRCLGVRMGCCDQQPLLQRHVDTSTAATTHQLQGTDDSLHCPETTRSQRTDSQHHLRQHHDDCLHQPLWRDEITATDGTGDVAMELVPEDRDEDSDDIRTIGLQPSGRSISTPNGTAGV